MARSTIQKITLGFGIVYALFGVLGFIPGITVPAARFNAVPGEGLLLGLFAVNVVHNLAHLLLGAVLIGGGLAAARVVAVNKGMAVVFLVLTVASFIAPLVEGVNLNPPDTVLHLASALLTGYLGFIAPRGAASPAGSRL